MTAPKTDPSGELKAITVRLVRDDYNRLQEYAYARKTSLNTVVTEAIVEYGRKIERREALDRIKAIREKIDPAKAAATDSVELIRQMREERLARLMGEGGGRKP